jgi:hypothetical protein
LPCNLESIQITEGALKISQKQPIGFVDFLNLFLILFREITPSFVFYFFCAKLLRKGAS